MSTRPLTMLLLGALLACVPAGTAAAQSLDPNLSNSTLPNLCAGLFQSSPMSLEDPGPLDTATLERSLAAQAPAPKPEEPTHTGFGALVRAIGSDFNAFPRRRSTYVILAIGGAAAAAVHPADDDINENLQDAKTLKKVLAPGKYLGSTYVQAGAAVGTYLIGRYAKPGGSRTNKYSHIGFDLLRAQIMTGALTYGIKVTVRRDRPTGECCSFPSGHASVTFATASVLERHFGYRGSWPMWVIASYVAMSRLTENRHFASDLLFGAALGVASGWTVVGRHGRDTFALFPVPTRGGAGVAGYWTPGAARHGN